MFQGVRNKALSCPELCHFWSPMEACGSGDPTIPTNPGGPLGFEDQSNSVLQEETGFKLKMESS